MSGDKLKVHLANRQIPAAIFRLVFFVQHRHHVVDGDTSESSIAEVRQSLPPGGAGAHSVRVA